MSIILALLAAVVTGVSDFIAGRAAREVSPWCVALFAQLGGAASVFAWSTVVTGSPAGVDWVWACAGGIFGSLGAIYLYRGLSCGRMGVVAPISGVVAVVLPLVVGLSLGERPSSTAWIGVLCALPAIWFVSFEPRELRQRLGAGSSRAIGDAVLAGIGFGGLYVCLSQISRSAGLAPVALAFVIGMCVIGTAGLALGQNFRIQGKHLRWTLLSGALGGLGAALFFLATITGDLIVPAVLISLYPACTVGLAALILNERPGAVQALGLIFCVLSVALIAGA